MLRLGVWVALAGCASAQTGFCSGNADAQAEPDVACERYGYSALCLPASVSPPESAWACAGGPRSRPTRPRSLVAMGTPPSARRPWSHAATAEVDTTEVITGATLVLPASMITMGTPLPGAECAA